MIDSNKDLLGIKQLSAGCISQILTNAAAMKYALLSGTKKMPHLTGKSMVTLFCENSTRTRLSFELAGKYLGANVSNVSAGGSSLLKGESLLDTARTIDAMQADVIVIRHPMSGTPHFIAKHVRAAVINGGDGMDEHPTQALLDAFTIKEKKGELAGLKVAIVGDVAHSRVARSNIYLLNKMGAKVSVGAPATLLPPEFDRLGAVTYTSTHEAILDADVVMGLRIQSERQQEGLFPSIREYSRFFGIDNRRMMLAKKDALIMHPGPVNRGVEYAGSTVDSPASVINEQVTNGVAVRMAVLNMILKRGIASENND